MRPALLGWLIVLALACAILLAARSAIDMRDASRVSARATHVLDSLARFRCVPLDSTTIIIRGRLQ